MEPEISLRPAPEKFVKGIVCFAIELRRRQASLGACSTTDETPRVKTAAELLAEVLELASRVGFETTFRRFFYGKPELLI